MTQKRTILLIGRTNSGKSTLANVLVNKENEFKEGKGGSSSTTERLQKGDFENNGITYQIIDTIGLSDTKLTSAQTIEKLLTVFSDTKEGINQILFVVKESFTREQIFFLNSLADIFFEKDFSRYITIVKTGFEEFENEEECKEDIEIIKKQDKRLEKFDLENKVIHVDNPSVNTKNKERNCLSKKEREKSREIILNHLENSCQNIHQIDVIFDFLDSFKKNNELNSESFKNLIKKIEENRSKINFVISENRKTIEGINKNKDSFSSLGIEKASLLALRTTGVYLATSTIETIVTEIFPPAEILIIPVCIAIVENENNVWKKAKGDKRKENWENWTQKLKKNGKKIEDLFKNLSSFDIAGYVNSNSISISEKINSFIERNKEELDNLSYYSSGDDKESSKFVEEFVELLEEINQSLISLNSAYQNPIIYTQKIINFLENVEFIAQMEQMPKQFF